MDKTVAVTGSGGLVGTELCRSLVADGIRVKRLVRGSAEPLNDGTTSAAWNPDGPVDPAVLADVDAVVHLAGENVAEGRWNAAKKARIRDSRVGPTRRLAEAAAKAGRPKVFVSASGVGYYGNRGDELLEEGAPSGAGFLADVGREWEAATEPATAGGLRVVLVRTGVVLSPDGGALAKQLPAFRAGVGATLGNGKQWVPWIAGPDLTRIYRFALTEQSLNGPVNAVAPNPVTNREFGRVLANVLGRPYLLRLPAWLLRLLFGELADAALLVSERVVPRRLTEAGFAFEHPELEGALKFLLDPP